MNERHQLDEARDELVRLGYLSHRFERFLLQDALVTGRPGRGLAILAGRVGLAGGALVAAVNTLALTLANRIFELAPGELPILFLHVFIPVALATAVGFLLVVIAFRLFLGAFPRRGLELARIGAALGAATAMVGVGVWLGWEFLVGLPRLERAALGALLPLVAGGVAKLVADGLLAFEIRWARHVPHERLVSRRTVALSIATSVALLVLGALALSPRPGPDAAAPLPVGNGERTLLIGIDGVLADELEFLLSRGELPALAALARDGGVLAGYERDALQSPAAFWTTVATGRTAVNHGVETLDGFRLLGMSVPLARTGAWRLYFASFAAPIGLADQQALLSGRRRAPVVWELVSHGGRPVVAINWWATYPAEVLPGVVVAHGAWDLAAQGDARAIAPDSRSAEILGLRGAESPFDTTPDTPSPGAAGQIERRAQAADAFYRAIARRLAPEAQALALYLPGPDLVAAAREPEPARTAALVRRELIATDRLLAEIGGEFGAIVWVIDPGRRGSGEGRALIWNGGCRAQSRPWIAPRQIASMLLRAAALPQSRQLTEPPKFCALPAAGSEVASYGERGHPAGPARADGEYLGTLRSLGYL